MGSADKKKIGIVSLGCSKNLVDSEIMLGKLQRGGYVISKNESECDIIIVNTCGFIDAAKQESINTILEMAKHKSGSCKLLIVTGCLSERYRDELIREIPEVDLVTGVSNYAEISDLIESYYNEGSKAVFGGDAGVDYLDETRLVSTGKAFAYVKIAEGCNNRCSYCIIPHIRGPYHSRTIESIVREASGLASQGIRELILIAQDTTKYGRDKYKKYMLAELLGKLSEVEGIIRIRVMYCYPDGLTDDLIDVIARDPKICKYIDLPLQHINSRILKDMGRPHDPESIKQLIARLRSAIPGVVIRTSLIVGFPGETEEEFEELYDFVKTTGFDNLGVFTYSKEESTPAAKMPAQVRQSVKNARRGRIMELQKQIAAEKAKALIGTDLHVLVEGVADDGIFYRGRSYREAPDVDGTIYFTAGGPLAEGDFVKVKILNADEYDLIGETEAGA